MNGDINGKEVIFMVIAVPPLVYVTLIENVENVIERILKSSFFMIKQGIIARSWQEVSFWNLNERVLSNQCYNEITKEAKRVDGSPLYILRGGKKMLGRERILKKAFPYIFLVSLFAFSFVPFFAFGSGLYSPPIVLKILAEKIGHITFPTFWAEIRFGPINCSNEKTAMNLTEYMNKVQRSVENNATIKRMGIIVAKFLEIKVESVAPTGRGLQISEMLLNTPSPSLYNALNVTPQEIRKVKLEEGAGPYYFYVTTPSDRIQLFSAGGIVFKRGGVLPIYLPLDLSPAHTVLIFFDSPRDLSLFLSHYFSEINALRSKNLIIKLVVADVLGIKIPNFKGMKEMSEVEQIISSIVSKEIPMLTKNVYLEKYVPTPIKLHFYPASIVNWYSWAESHIREVISWMSFSSIFFFEVALVGIITSANEYYERLNAKIDEIESKIRLRGIIWRSSRPLAYFILLLIFFALVFGMWSFFYVFHPEYANYLIWIGAAVCLLAFSFGFILGRRMQGTGIPLFFFALSAFFEAATYVRIGHTYPLLSALWTACSIYIYSLILLAGIYSVVTLVDLLLMRKFPREYVKNKELTGIGSRGAAILLSLVVVASLLNFSSLYLSVPLIENNLSIKLAAFLFPTWFNIIYLPIIVVTILYFLIKLPYAVSFIRSSIEGMKRRGIPPRGIFFEIWKRFVRFPLLRLYLLLALTIIATLFAIDSYTFFEFSYPGPHLQLHVPSTRLLYHLGLYNVYGILALVIPFSLYGSILVYLGVRSLWRR